jgi:hypothetical protein
MAQCLLLTDVELAALIAAGWIKSSGPHALEGSCIAACTGGTSSGQSQKVPDDCGCGTYTDPQSWYFEMSGVTDGCTGCTQLNGRHTLAYAGKVGTGSSAVCYWSKQLASPANCGGFPAGQYITLAMNLSGQRFIYLFSDFLSTNNVVVYEALSTWNCNGPNTFTRSGSGGCVNTPATFVLTPI